MILRLVFLMAARASADRRPRSWRQRCSRLDERKHRKARRKAQKQAAKKAAKQAKQEALLAKPLKAFLVWEPTFLYVFPESWAVYAARTSGEARAHGVRSLEDAYDSRDLRDILQASPWATMRAVRCPEYDAAALAETTHAYKGRLSRHHAQIASGTRGVPFPRPEMLSVEQRIRGYLSKNLDNYGRACERARSCPAVPPPSRTPERALPPMPNVRAVSIRVAQPRRQKAPPTPTPVPPPLRKRDFHENQEVWLCGPIGGEPRAINVIAQDPGHGRGYLTVEDENGTFGVHLRHVHLSRAAAEVTVCEQAVNIKTRAQSAAESALAKAKKHLARAQAKLAREAAKPKPKKKAKP